jgi:hypothetical protein
MLTQFHGLRVYAGGRNKAVSKTDCACRLIRVIIPGVSRGRSFAEDVRPLSNRRGNA